MALSNWDILCMNEKGEPCKGEFISPMGISCEIYKNWIHIKDEYAHRKNNHVMQKPVISKIITGELRYMDINIKCEFQYSDNNSLDNDSLDTVEYNRILYSIWHSYNTEPDFKGICGVACFGDIHKNDIDALKIFLCDENNDYSTIPKRFKNFDLLKGKRYNQGDNYFHKVLGSDRQCTNVGESKATILAQVFNNK